MSETSNTAPGSTPANLKQDNASRIQGLLKKTLASKLPAATMKVDVTTPTVIPPEAGQEGPVTERIPSTLPDLLELQRNDRIYKVPLEWLDFEDNTFYNRQNHAELLAEPESEELKTTLTNFGQQVPCIVQFNDAGKLQIIDGWRRSLCLRDLNAASVEIRVVKLDKKMAAQLAAVANFSREDLPDYQRASYINKLCTAFEINKDEVAAMTGLGKRYIYRVLNLFNSENAAFHDALAENKIGLTAAIRLSDGASNLSPEEKANLVSKVISSGKKSATEAVLDATLAAKEAKEPKSKKDKGGKEKKSYFISDSKTGKIQFKAVAGKKSTKTEIDVILRDLSQFKDALAKLRKGIK